MPAGTCIDADAQLGFAGKADVAALGVEAHDRAPRLAWYVPETRTAGILHIGKMIVVPSSTTAPPVGPVLLASPVMPASLSEGVRMVECPVRIEVRRYFFE